MRFLPIVALAIPLFSHAGAPGSTAFQSWEWQRVIKPAESSPVAEQCVVLDAALYTSAAPGLRDVRLLQDGHEIAYAVQESYDEMALGKGAGHGDLSDRSLYTTVLRVPLAATLIARNANTASAAGSHSQQGSGLLPRHVPVERMQLVPAADASPAGMNAYVPAAAIHLRLVATPAETLSEAAVGQDRGELVQDELDGDHPVEMTALGANLQGDAKVAVDVESARQFSGVLLQMHQRSICFQPLSRAPLILLAGNSEARPVHYDYALHYRPISAPLLATMGPIQRNPMYRPHAAERASMTRTERFILATSIAVCGFLLTAAALLRRH